MQTTSVKLYSLEYSEAKTYLAAALFLAGNIVLPQLFHTIRLGGPTWLPIYFFTLVGAYKYGWRAGLLTALASPVANALLFGMPAAAALSAIVLKSVLLAGAAGYAAARFRRASLALLAAVVLFYQAAGTLGEWALAGSFHAAVQDFRIGLPGMLLQIFGGWAFINFINPQVRRCANWDSAVCGCRSQRPATSRPWTSPRSNAWSTPSSNGASPTSTRPTCTTISTASASCARRSSSVIPATASHWPPSSRRCSSNPKGIRSGSSPNSSRNAASTTSTTTCCTISTPRTTAPSSASTASPSPPA